MTYLERKHPKRWGRRMDVTSGDEPIQGALPVKVETAEEARQALRTMGVSIRLRGRAGRPRGAGGAS